MKNRYLPYGYKIDDGRYVTDPAEAEAVREIFRLYGNGHSYKTIAGILDSGPYPAYSTGGWNKHHIKRMLENRRYTGGGPYPAILSAAQFAAARAVLEGKTAGRVYDAFPGKVLWSRIVCGECGEKMRRAGNRLTAKGVARLHCVDPGCGHRVEIAADALCHAVARMGHQAPDAPGAAAFRGWGPDILRLDSQISRAVARPDDPAEAVRMILRGISAKYSEVPSPPAPARAPEYDGENHLSGPGWERFGEVVSHISLSRAGIGMKTVTGYEYFMERTDGHANDSDSAAPKGSDRHPRESPAEPLYGAAGE